MVRNRLHAEGEVVGPAAEKDGSQMSGFSFQKVLSSTKCKSIPNMKRALQLFIIPSQRTFNIKLLCIISLHFRNKRWNVL